MYNGLYHVMAYSIGKDMSLSSSSVDKGEFIIIVPRGLNVAKERH